MRLGIRRAKQCSAFRAAKDGLSALMPPDIETGDWKVAFTRRQECLRYGLNFACFAPPPIDL
jgi:hypothetical protein